MLTLDLGTTTVSYLTAGEGDPVVFLHSGPGSAADWRGVFDRFGPGFQLIAVNGFGKGQTSPWPRGQIHVDDVVELVAGLVTSLGAPAHIVGHSYGGAVALRLALIRPQLVRSLALIEPQVYPQLREADPDLFAQASQVADAFSSAVSDGRLDEAWRGFIDHYGSSGSWDALPERARNQMLAISPAAVRSWRALFTNPLRVTDLEQIQVPTLVLQGGHSTPPERRMCEIVTTGIGSAQHLVVNGAGHMLPLTHPAAVMEALQPHLHRRTEQPGHETQTRRT